MGKRTMILIAAAVAALTLVVTPGALASGGADVIKRGNCTGAADWKLKLGRDDGRIEVEFEVDQNRVGKRWHVVLRHDGDKFFDGFRRTQAPSSCSRSSGP